MNMTTIKENFPKEQNEHPFAPIVRILGKGKKGSRSLTQEEAVMAMTMILNNDVLDLQLGAFLMLLRVKEESAEELAGFVEAAHQSFQFPQVEFDIDWSSYAGKKRHPPWFIFSAYLLSQNGLRIFMHGAEGHTQGRLYTREVLTKLGLPVISKPSDLETTEGNFVYLPLQGFAPRLHDIIQMRSILGLRSPVHSMARLLNPCMAKTVVQGIFHPPYSSIHQSSGNLLNYQNLIVIKGEGGEFECNPDNDILVKWAKDNQTGEETWPRDFQRRHVKPETVSIDNMLNVWRGNELDEYAEGAIISTGALVLKHHLNLTRDDAYAQMRDWWKSREKDRF